MKKKIISLVVCVMMCIGVLCACGSNDPKTHRYDDEKSYAETVDPDIYEETETEEETKPLSESDALTLSLVSLMDENLVFDVGDYIKGDIPSGEYAFVKFSGSGSYYCEKDSAGNIIDNENFDSFGYVTVHEAGNLTTKGVLVNVDAFDKLGVSSAKDIYETLNNLPGYNEGGYYKIGVDIPAGQCILESYGDGYWAIMSAPVGNSGIVDNDIFNGRAEVNVVDGQYLKVSRAKILQ